MLKRFTFVLLLMFAFSKVGLAATHSVVLTWIASQTPGVTYNIYRTATSPSCKVSVLTTGVTALTFTDNAVTNGATYFYSVDAQNSGGKSACTSPDVQVQIPIDPPSPPSGLNATVQ
jgi:fibronectin type 3 domain-containing protein